MPGNFCSLPRNTFGFHPQWDFSGCLRGAPFKVSRSCVKAEQEERRRRPRISFRLPDWYRASGVCIAAWDGESFVSSNGSTRRIFTWLPHAVSCTLSCRVVLGVWGAHCEYFNFIRMSFDPQRRGVYCSPPVSLCGSLCPPFAVREQRSVSLATYRLKAIFTHTLQFDSVST